jgi:hypothetical protein
MRISSTALALSMVIGISGCAQVHSTDASRANTGTLIGRIAMFGGPLNPSTGQMALNNSPGQDMAVSATAPGGRVAATVTSDSYGQFTLALAPGRYSVKAQECGPGASAVVVAGQQTVIGLRCDVP